MRFKESDLKEFSNPLSETEKDQAKRSIEMVKDALINAGYKLNKGLTNYSGDFGTYAYYYELCDSIYGNITVLLQGSYANNTNIKAYSDVDVSVVYKTTISLQFKMYKDSIYRALREKFGTEVIKKNKSIRVEGNTYRKSIDVVPAYPIKQNVNDGIYFITDSGQEIKNYPLQQIDNENQKNSNTNYYYKKYVRIFKNFRYLMEKSVSSSSKRIGSFQIESLLYNVPSQYFTKYSVFGNGVKEIINYLLSAGSDIVSYKESNGIKNLCNDIETYYSLKSFITELNSFFEYEVY